MSTYARELRCFLALDASCSGKAELSCAIVSSAKSIHGVCVLSSIAGVRELVMQLISSLGWYAAAVGLSGLSVVGFVRTHTAANEQAMQRQVDLKQATESKDSSLHSVWPVVASTSRSGHVRMSQMTQTACVKLKNGNTSRTHMKPDSTSTLLFGAPRLENYHPRPF